ncbi:TPA: hypothetical protein P0E12_005142 [Vibrio harveyi]|nr:hypothetical protein [Vibrio harveyi]
MDMFEDIEEFEKRLELPVGFYKALYAEDDWSFVIKLSALFEAASSHILTVRLGAPEIHNELSFLDYANDKFGKLQLLRVLGCLSDEQFKFLKALAVLRNSLAHRIQNVDFDFHSHLASKNKDQMKSFAKIFGYALNSELEVDGKTVSPQDYLKVHVKEVIWRCSADILACLHLEIAKKALDDDIKALEWSKVNIKGQ